MKSIWHNCEKVGFKYLRTRAFNQDSLDNTFAQVRQYGGGNDNPNCFRFIGALKTATLNNLIANHSSDSNCQEQEGIILDNLQDFLMEDNLHGNPIIVDDMDNEFLHLQPPYFNPESLSDASFDTQALAYVCGYLVKKKIKNLECLECKTNLLAADIEPHHTFT